MTSSHFEEFDDEPKNNTPFGTNAVIDPRVVDMSWFSNMSPFPSLGDDQGNGMVPMTKAKPKTLGPGVRSKSTTDPYNPSGGDTGLGYDVHFPRSSASSSSAGFQSNEDHISSVDGMFENSAPYPGTSASSSSAGFRSDTYQNPSGYGILFGSENSTPFPSSSASSSSAGFRSNEDHISSGYGMFENSTPFPGTMFASSSSAGFRSNTYQNPSGYGILFGSENSTPFPRTSASSSSAGFQSNEDHISSVDGMFENSAPYPGTSASSSSAGFQSNEDHISSGYGMFENSAPYPGTSASSPSPGFRSDTYQNPSGDGALEGVLPQVVMGNEDTHSPRTSGAAPNSNTIEIGESWTKADDALLRSLVEPLPRTASGRIERGEFKNIVSRFSGRTYEQLHQRYYLLKTKTLPWASEYDAKLSEAVKEYGREWKLIQERYFPERQARALRTRYENYINPELKQGPLSQDEEEQIFRYEFGLSPFTTRSELARSMKRSENCCKNHWSRVTKAMVCSKKSSCFTSTWKAWLKSPKRAKWIKSATAKFERNSRQAARETSSSVNSETTIPDPESASYPLVTTATPLRCASAPSREAEMLKNVTSATPRRPASALSISAEAKRDPPSDGSRQATTTMPKRLALATSRGVKAIKLGPASTLPGPSSSSSSSRFHSVEPGPKGT